MTLNWRRQNGIEGRNRCNMNYLVLRTATYIQLQVRPSISRDYAQENLPVL